MLSQRFWLTNLWKDGFWTDNQESAQSKISRIFRQSEINNASKKQYSKEFWDNPKYCDSSKYWHSPDRKNMSRISKLSWIFKLLRIQRLAGISKFSNIPERFVTPFFEKHSYPYFIIVFFWRTWWTFFQTCMNGRVLKSQSDNDHHSASS